MPSKGADSFVWLFQLYTQVTSQFIPEELLRSELSARRSRLIVAANFVGIATCSLSLLELLYIRPEFTWSIAAIVCLFLMMPVNLLLFRLTRSYIASGFVSALIFLALIAVSAYSYGGSFGAIMTWLPAVPITATFLTGRRAGFLVAIMTIAVAVTIYALDRSGYAFPYLMSREELLRIGPFVVVGAIVYVTMLGEFYEWTHAEFRRSLLAEKEQRNEVERALDVQSEQSLVTLQSIADGVITTDADDQITYMNPVAVQLTGWQSEEAMGRSLSEVFMVFDEHSHEPAGHFMQSCLNKQYEAPVRNHVLLSYDGREMLVEHHASLIRDAKDNVKGLVIVFQDVTTQRKLATQLRYQESHDSLSNLLNRHEFGYRLQLLIAERKPDTHHMLCTIDISQFRVINDSCGHAAGDELIRQFADILRDAASNQDLLARLGGNEFAMVILDATEAMAMDEVMALREKLDNYRFNWEDKSFAIATAIGLVSIDGSTDNAADLLNDADAARQAAKEMGRNSVHRFEPDDHELLNRRGEMRWAAYLNGVIEEDRFMLVRQTIAPLLVEGGGAHYEVLLRCRDDEGSITEAEEFLTVAERYNLATDIDGWVVKKLVDWFEAHPEDLINTDTASVNLSGRSITDTRFAQELMRQLHRIPGLAEKFCFEITETAAIANLNKARKFILEMRALGCRFALDDFGKGMSSLSYLKALPVDYLKIDGEFVKNMLNDPIDNAMVEHINQIAHMIGMKTVAEYAENEDIIQRLRELRVDFAQGYGVDRPMPLSPMKSSCDDEC